MSDQSLALAKAHNAEMQRISPMLASLGDGPIPNFLKSFMMAKADSDAEDAGSHIGGFDLGPIQKAWRDGPLAVANARAKAFRDAPYVGSQFATVTELAKSNPTIAKAAELDVGSLTNFAQITGGQALGNVSLDTELARGTVRPNSMTLYQALNKSMAKQIVDYWGYAAETGGAPVGSAFASYASVGSGTLMTSAGQYDLEFTTLKLMVDGRAITMALAAQNSYVNVAETETANAALVVTQTANWATYWGNSVIYANQFNGIIQQIPSNNIIDFSAYATAHSSSGLSPEQLLFNLIYERCASITKFRLFGKITHAFMPPDAIGGLQSLTTTQLTNWLNSSIGDAEAPITINGNLVGMNTRFGPVKFPLDLFITARDVPLQGVVLQDGTNQAGLNTTLNAPTSVTAAVNAAVAGSEFTTAYVAAGYIYAVAAADASMNESVLTFTSVVTGLAANGGVTLTITPNGSAQVAYRVFRSGMGYTGQADGSSLSPDPQQFRFIADVVANGSSAVTFQDLNTRIPGGSSIFLLDLDDNDNALDWRCLLPLTKIDLFAGNLFLPWAVAMIGAPRIRVPKWHSVIKNYVPSNPDWNPLTAVNPVLPAGG
jgi:hypothetical protein